VVLVDTAGNFHVVGFVGVVGMAEEVVAAGIAALVLLVGSTLVVGTENLTAAAVPVAAAPVQVVMVVNSAAVVTFQESCLSHLLVVVKELVVEELAVRLEH